MLRFAAVGIGLVFVSAAGDNARAATQAVADNDFLNSMGVCTHISQGADLEANVATSLTFAGLRNIRDDGTTDPSTWQDFVNLHNATGAKVSLLPIAGDINSSRAEFEALATGGALLAAEGPNEPNNAPFTYNGNASGSDTTFLPVAQFQRDMYNAVKADAKLKGIPVFASSEAGGSEPDNVGLQFLTIPAGAGTSMPTGTVLGDYANTHNYVKGNGLTKLVLNTAWQAEDPTLDSNWDGMYGEYGITWNKHFTGYPISSLPTLPRVTTETGWPTQGTGAISQAQQGTLLLDLYLDAYKRGWSYTFVYYLHDTTDQGAWGIFDTNYNAKTSGTYIHNLTTILADKTSFSTGSLNYSIASEPATVHDLLLQNSNGTFHLAVWDEHTNGTKITNDTVTVNLGASFPSVKIYDPTVGTAATQTLSNVSSVTLTLGDHPMIIAVPGTVSGTNTDTPTMPPLGFVFLAALLIVIAAMYLPEMTTDRRRVDG